MYRWSLVLALAVLTALVGCSGDKRAGPPTVKAGGVVLMNGQPVQGAQVYFSPQAGSAQLGARAAYGVTSAKGRFQLSTSSDIPGALPGEYTVGIAKERAEGGMTPEDAKQYYQKNKAPPKTVKSPKLINDLPDKYKNPAKSQLMATIKAEGPNEFTFELKKD